MLFYTETGKSFNTDNVEITVPSNNGVTVIMKNGLRMVLTIEEFKKYVKMVSKPLQQSIAIT